MIRRVENYRDGSVVSTEEWDTVAGLYTVRNSSGVQVLQRPITAIESAELSALDSEQAAGMNGKTLQDRARTALAANAAFIAIASPTNTQILAQVRRLTKECSALIRLAIGELGDITDTE